MSVSSVNRVLKKGAGVENAILRRIGKALGYSFGEMLVLSGQAERDELPVRPPEMLEEAPPPEPDTNPFSDPYERQIWEWDKLSEDVRRYLIITLRTALQMEADTL